MSAGQIADLVTAVVALAGAATAYLHSKATRKIARQTAAKVIAHKNLPSHGMADKSQP